MIEREVHQIVLPVGTPQPIKDRVGVLAQEENEKRTSLPLKAKARLIAGRILHPVMHTWVVWHGYDENCDCLVELGLTCMFCPAGKAG